MKVDMPLNKETETNQTKINDSMTSELVGFPLFFIVHDDIDVSIEEGVKDYKVAFHSYLHWEFGRFIKYNIQYERYSCWLVNY